MQFDKARIRQQWDKKRLQLLGNALINTFRGTNKHVRVQDFLDAVFPGVHATSKETVAMLVSVRGQLY
jgi:hypothetical protein